MSEKDDAGRPGEGREQPGGAASRPPMMLDAQGRPMAIPPEGVLFVPAGGGPAVQVSPGGRGAPRMLDQEGRPLEIPPEGVLFVPAGSAAAPERPVPGALVGGIAPAGAPMAVDTRQRPPAAPGRPAAAAPALPRIEPRSEELEEVVSFVPHWLVRWGTVVVFGVVATLLAIAWLVRYPEIISGRATLTTPEPPVRVVARTPGEVEALFVADGARVERGAVLAVLRSSAELAAVLRVSAVVDTLDPLGIAGRGAALANETALGDLQQPYSALMLALADLRAFEAGTFDGRKLGALEVQMRSQQRLRENLQLQLGMLQEQLRVAGSERDRSRELASRQLISRQEVERAEAEYVRARLQLENARNSLTSSEIQIAGQTGTLLEVQQKHEETRRQYVQAVRGAADALRAARDRWRQDYLLIAPTGGRVAFFRPLTRGQYLGAAEPVLAVVPNGGRAVAAQVRVPQAGSGKIREGQRVIIRFDGYPTGEFGVVRGAVDRISLLPDDAGDEPHYLLQVGLPDELTTSTGKVLPFRQEMRGTADVVTEDVRLFERIFRQLYSVVATARGG